jgi:hypothetical protein
VYDKLADAPSMNHAGQASAKELSGPMLSRTLRICMCVLCLLTSTYFAGSILYHILRYGVQIPFWDDWDFVGYLQRFTHGQLSVPGLLLVRQAEHRIGLPASVTVLLWHLTGMNLRLMMALNWCLSLALILLGALITRKGLQSRGVLPWVVLALSSLFIFNPAAYQLWMWDYPPEHVIVAVLFLAGVHVVQYRISVGTSITVVAVLALIASFTFGSGLLLWVLFPIALVPMLGHREILRAGLAAGFYAFLWLLTAAIYTQGFFAYHSPAPSAKTSLRVLVSFFLAYTGNLVLGYPEPGLVTWAHVMGLLIILVFCAATAGAVKACYGTETWPVVVVWLCLGVYGISAGVLVSFARHGFGVSYAVESSRYVLYSAMFPVAASALACICIAQSRARLPQGTAWYSVSLTALTVLVTASLVIRGGQTPTAWGAFRLSHSNELKGKVALSAANFLELPEYRYIFPHDDWNRFRTLANFITTEAGLRPGMWDDRFVQKLADTVPETRPYGFVDRIALDTDKIQLRGWAYLQDRREASDAVIVTAGTAGERARLMAVVFPSEARWDVAAATQSDPDLQTGWVATLPRKSFSSGAAVIHCYAYDAESGRVQPLRGPTTLPSQ